MKQIRFIHTADLHLGSPFTGMTDLQKEHLNLLKNSTLEAFDRLIEYAMQTRPDFILIAGDIYDGEDRNLKAQYRFQQGMEKLDRVKIPVFISYGNHDHLGGSWTRFELPENVHIFTDNVSQASLTTDSAEVLITGFSYGERHIREPMISGYPEADDEGTFHIGMLHGSMEGESAHAVYAPFTKQQLLSKNYDYWALGHIHTRQELHQDPPIVYPGNIQGRHRNEPGEKGFYDITLSQGNAELNFIPVSSIHFDRMDISCAGLMHMNELLDLCKEAAAGMATQYGSAILDVHFFDLDEGSVELLKEVSEEELLEALREAVATNSGFLWINRISFQHTLLEGEMSPLGEKIIQQMEEWDAAEWKKVLKDLYRHPKGSRFLPKLTEESTNELLEISADKIRRGMRTKE
ncbi:MAG TPA: DNA repair exonuclease [Planococcus sp. (in: firmicutes)]|nr:DNA repair exonuclease [Planococcus sp. (in: firmicutes)]